jgi:release factor glutamine methyltransferase
MRLYTHYEHEVDEGGAGAFRELVRRRAEGTPVAYLVGRKEFYSLPLTVSPAVLIPRPDSEFVVVEFLAVAKALASPRVVDVGTARVPGPGLRPAPSLGAVRGDRHQPEALAVAEANARALGLLDRVDFREGTCSIASRTKGPFDVILSNPPYISTADVANLEPGVRLFEPHRALDGGEDGLRVVAPLIEQAGAAPEAGAAT